MGLFKNEVGRSSNEVLRKRRILVFVLIVVGVLLVVMLAGMAKKIHLLQS